MVKTIQSYKQNVVEISDIAGRFEPWATISGERRLCGFQITLLKAAWNCRSSVSVSSASS